MRFVLLAYAFVAFVSAPAWAQSPPALSFPVECKIGTDCWMFSFVDTKPGPGYVDFREGYRTYDGHEGTDIALTNPADITKSVGVLAAASGTVVGTRDGIADNQLGSPNFPDGKDCGNGIRIDHGGGWMTQYCHLKRGSIRVKTGDQVAVGATLAAVGNSGNSETPHLHLSLEHHGKAVDPFSGRRLDGSIAASRAMWSASALERFGAYRSTHLRHIGFAAGKTDLALARRGSPAHLPANSPALVIYTTLYGIATGDTIELEIFGPTGARIFEHSEQTKKPWSRFHQFGGRRTPVDGWPTGTYVGRVSVSGTFLGETRVELR